MLGLRIAQQGNLVGAIWRDILVMDATSKDGRYKQGAFR